MLGRGSGPGKGSPTGGEPARGSNRAGPILTTGGPGTRDSPGLFQLFLQAPLHVRPGDGVVRHLIPELVQRADVRAVLVVEPVHRQAQGGRDREVNLPALLAALALAP